MTRPDMTPNDWVPSPKARAWLYVAAAAGTLLAVYGLVTPEQLDGWQRLAHALVYAVDAGALVLAARNTPRGRHAA